MALSVPSHYIWTNVGILLIGPLRTNFSEISIEIHTFLFKKMHLKVSSAKWRPFWLVFNVLYNILHCILTRSRHIWAHDSINRTLNHSISCEGILYIMKSTHFTNTFRKRATLKGQPQIDFVVSVHPTKWCCGWPSPMCQFTNTV